MTKDEREIFDKLSRLADLPQLISAYQKENVEFFTAIITHLDDLDTLREKRRIKAAQQQRFRAKKAGCGQTNVDTTNAIVDTTKEEERKDEKERGEIPPHTPPIEGGEKEEKKGEENPFKSPQGGKKLSAKELSLLFEQWWVAYPHYRRVAKSRCKKKMDIILSAPKTADEQRALHNDIMAGLHRWLGSDDWSRDSGDYVPLTTTWLNQERWACSPRPKGSVSNNVKKPSNWLGMREDQIDDVLG